jgi:apolipoprotein N-acyltransferase
MQHQVFSADVVVLAPAWRALAAALKVFARSSLLVMVAAVLFSDDAPTNPLAQMGMFAGLFLAPEAAAWCIARAFAARLWVENGTITLDQRTRRTEIPIAAVAAVAPWRLPLPGVGVSLRLERGGRFAQGILLADPAGFVDALCRQGGPPSLADGLAGRAAAYASARSANPPGMLDNPAVKFVVFSLVPTVPAFRLHQYIAYGGPFGEYQTFGLQAYLIGFTIWWVSWAIGLVLFAAILRVAVEAGTLVLLPLNPGWLPRARRGLEMLSRVLFYLGVPLWLLIRLWPW